jgi:Flp pilus assembly protein TadG
VTRENKCRRTIQSALREWRRDETGQAIVETAIVMSLTLILVIGVIEASMAFYSYCFVAEAAREGTRYAIVRGSSCSGWAQACPAAASDVQAYVRSMAFPGIMSSSLSVNTTWPTTGSACMPSSSPCNNPGNLVQVKVSYQFTYNVPLVSSNLLTVSSTSEMTIAQ